jgi:hypothetical protein
MSQIGPPLPTCAVHQSRLPQRYLIEFLCGHAAGVVDRRARLVTPKEKTPIVVL